MAIDESDVQPMKAPLPNVCRFSDNTTLRKDIQFSKAAPPIFFMVFGMETFTTLVPLNAESPILVTVNSLP